MPEATPSAVFAVKRWSASSSNSRLSRATLVISGGGQNPSALEGRPALLDVPLGKGDVLVYNFNPMHRDMNHHDSRYLYNGILNWRYITSRRPEGG